jgi:SAM-dependent methyltransferase
MSESSISRHYGRRDLLESILEGLRAAGKDPEAPHPDDLGMDHFHAGGREATLALAGLAGLTSGIEVLDVGGGFGGAARLLASQFGCRVTVLDVTEAFCRVGSELTRRMGLADRVAFHHADALAMPFPDARFDVVWTQHSSMNVEDKERLYREIHRVLRPGGRLALHEILAGPAGGVLHLPVPWAREPGISFLRPADAIRTLLAGLGFQERHWRDVSAAALDSLRQGIAAAGAGPPPPLGMHLILGGDVPAMVANAVRNLEEGRIAVVQAVVVRPS